MINKENETNDAYQQDLKMAAAVRAAIYEGTYGTLINFDLIPNEELKLLMNEAKKVIDWRNAPNREVGGH